MTISFSHILRFHRHFFACTENKRTESHTHTHTWWLMRDPLKWMYICMHTKIHGHTDIYISHRWNRNVAIGRLYLLAQLAFLRLQLWSVPDYTHTVEWLTLFTFNGTKETAENGERNRRRRKKNHRQKLYYLINLAGRQSHAFNRIIHWSFHSSEFFHYILQLIALILSQQKKRERTRMNKKWWVGEREMSSEDESAYKFKSIPSIN